MYKTTKVLGGSFRAAIASGTIKVKNDAMYLCTLGLFDHAVEATVDDVSKKAGAIDLPKDHSLVLSLHEDEILLSDTHKYYVVIRYPFYHLILDTVLSIFYIKENDPDAIFILTTSKLFLDSPNDEQKTMQFLVEILELNNIPFYFITGSRYYDKEFKYNHSSTLARESMTAPFALDLPIYKVKNCTVVAQPFARYMTFRDLVDLCEKYILSRIPTTSRSESKKTKIYISRGGSNSKGESFKDANNPSLGYANVRDRIYEDALIEEYLESIGFIVLNPTDMSIVDQIKIMNSADVLVGVTGTGLINSMFMPRGSTIVELQVELFFGDRIDETIIVSDYWQLSQAKEHTYIGIDLIDKQGATAVKKLKSLFGALDLDKLS